MKRMKKLLVGLLSLMIVMGTGAQASADGESVEIEIFRGNYFYFGRFEQDNNLTNGAEPIQWRILDTDWDTGYMLALSEYGLYTMNYHHSNRLKAWGDTDVRYWLNHPFVETAFTDAEKAHIVTKEVSGSWDRLFLLNETQIEKYLNSPYLCQATAYAIATGAYVNDKTGTSSWLVRTDYAEERIAWVGGAGKLYSPKGNNGVNYLTSADNVVRPAMWISMEEINDGVVSVAQATPWPATRKTIWAPTLDTTIATRSGPSTGYNGIGSYKNVQEVRVLSRASDGSIWWLLVEFPYNGLTVRCYTGLKRVNVDINLVPDEVEQDLGTGVVVREPDAYYGPGKTYKKQTAQFTPAVGTTGRAIAEENGWYCFEYQQEGKNSRIRVWLQPEDLSVTR